MFDIESMPDLLKPCGIVYSKNCFEQQTRPDENYQLIQDILVSKSPDLFSKSDGLPFHHEGMFEANTSVIPVENVTPVTPPFSIEPVVPDQFYPYTNLHKVNFDRSAIKKEYSYFVNVEQFCLSKFKETYQTGSTNQWIIL